MKRRPLLKSTLAASALMLSGLFPFTLQAAETIKVGILHSLSGTMAISETSLKDMALMTIDEINAKGGVLGKWWSIRRPTGHCSPKRAGSC
jgi:urea transport system substrate-binding protein